MIRALLLLAAALCTGCAASAQPAPPWTAALVAGDDSLPVFANATGRMASLLAAAGVPPAAIHRWSADGAGPDGTGLATKAGVLAGIAALHPQAGQACFVFLTSHGGHGLGLYLSRQDEFIQPAELDRALAAGCGGAPTVAVVSGCYTGSFARPPMARPNRVILTAAAADRPSFGCGAGDELTFYDQCLLQDFDGHPRGWPEAAAGTARCVAALEREGGERPSHPQSAIGAAAAVPPPP